MLTGFSCFSAKIEINEENADEIFRFQLLYLVRSRMLGDSRFRPFKSDDKRWYSRAIRSK